MNLQNLNNKVNNINYNALIDNIQVTLLIIITISLDTVIVTGFNIIVRLCFFFSVTLIQIRNIKLIQMHFKIALNLMFSIF